jgi:electron transport complex protein RnfC
MSNMRLPFKKKRRLVLSSDVLEIQDAPEPQEILLPLGIYKKGEPEPKVAVGRRVVTGEQVLPDIFSPVTGTVKSIESYRIERDHYAAASIEVAEREELEPTIQKQLDFLNIAPAELQRRLHLVNLGFPSELEQFDAVIVSAVDADPLSAVQQQVLRENEEPLHEGLKLLQRLTGAKNIILAVPEYLSASGTRVAGGLADVFPVKPDYPNGLPEILGDDISRSFGLDDFAFITAEKLTGAVNCLREGKPFAYKVVTVAGKGDIQNLRVRLGTRIGELLKHIPLGDGGKVMIGGPMRGVACYHTDVPVTAEMDSLYVQDADEVVWYENLQCTNCGCCVEACPAYLDVNLIGRYAEFAIFDKCQELEVSKCIECGLCAYVCPSRRSLVQLIRLAKKEIADMENEDIDGEKEVEEETEGEKVS